MHQLSPQESFPIVYVLADPNDTATYYVRSVMRNSVSGAIIRIANANFVNLISTPGNTRRFTKTIQAPADINGNGFYIDITTTVYTDSGYTTKSDAYAEQLDKYLVQLRPNVSLGFGGSAGPLTVAGAKDGYVDYEKIKKIFIEVLKEVIKDPEKLDLKPVMDGLDKAYEAIGNVHSSVKGIPTKIADPIDLAPFSDEIINTILLAIANIDFPIVDFTPILAKIDDIDIPAHPDLAPQFEALKAEIVKMQGENVNQKYGEFLNQLSEAVTKIKPKEARQEVNMDRFKALM